jgi:hypothetical protein
MTALIAATLAASPRLVSTRKAPRGFGQHD